MCFSCADSTCVPILVGSDRSRMVWAEEMAVENTTATLGRRADGEAGGSPTMATARRSPANGSPSGHRLTHNGVSPKYITKVLNSPRGIKKQSHRVEDTNDQVYQGAIIKGI
jgi:hypothetical protein